MPPEEQRELIGEDMVVLVGGVPSYWRLQGAQWALEHWLLQMISSIATPLYNDRDVS